MPSPYSSMPSPYINNNLPPPPSSPFRNIHLPLLEPSPRFSNGPKLSVSSPPPSPPKYSTPSHDDFTPTSSNPPTVPYYSPLADYRIPKRFLHGEFASISQNIASTPKPPLSHRGSESGKANLLPPENCEDSIFGESSPQKDSSMGTSSIKANSPGFLSANSPAFHSFNSPNQLISTNWSPNYSRLGFSPISNLNSATTKDPKTPPTPNPSEYSATDPRIPARFLTGPNLRHCHHLLGSSPNIKLQGETQAQRDVPRNQLGEAVEEEKFWFNDGRIPNRYLLKKELSSQIHQDSLVWMENNEPRNNKDPQEENKDRKRTKSEVARMVPKRFFKTDESFLEKNERNEMQDIFQRIPLRFLEAGTETNLKIPRRYLRQGQMKKKLEAQSKNESK